MQNKPKLHSFNILEQGECAAAHTEVELTSNSLIRNKVFDAIKLPRKHGMGWENAEFCFFQQIYSVQDMANVSKLDQSCSAALPHFLWINLVKSTRIY